MRVSEHEGEPFGDGEPGDGTGVGAALLVGGAGAFEVVGVAEWRERAAADPIGERVGPAGVPDPGRVPGLGGLPRPWEAPGARGSRGGMPPARAATTGQPDAIASSTTKPSVSVVDGINSLHTAMAEYSALIASGNASVIDFLSAPPEAYSGGSSGGGYSGGSSGSSSSSGSWTAEGYWSKNPDLQEEFARANLASSPDFDQDPALSAELEYAT